MYVDFSTLTSVMQDGAQCKIELCGGAVHLRHADLDAAEAKLKLCSSELKSSLDLQLDLVPYVYEGTNMQHHCCF